MEQTSTAPNGIHIDQASGIEKVEAGPTRISSASSPTRDEEESDSPPTDRGWRAWRVVIASFVYEGLQWGFPLSFGIFQDYFIANNTFPGDAQLIPTIGVLSTSILYLGSPLMSVYVEQRPAHRVALIWAGWALQIVALVGASFCTSVPQLIVTQGFVYSLGDLIVYMPMMSLINEWFERKRGLAYGLVDASTGLTGIVFPFVLQAVLARFGWRTTLRAFAVFFSVFTLPFLPFLRTRLPPATPAPFSMRHYGALFLQPRFHAYSISNVLQGLGFFMPPLFLPTYARALGLSPTLGAMLIALLSAAQFLGQIVFGYLSDGKRVPLHVLMFTSSFVAGAATLTLWGLATGLAPLVCFAIAYGFFASAFVVLYARMGTALTTDPKAELASYALFSAQKGLGNILDGPISGALWRAGVVRGQYGVGEFGRVVGFTGACLVLSALVVLLYHYGRLCAPRSFSR